MAVVFGGIERWCGEQLLAIANDHLGPRLDFKSLDYQRPTTVWLYDLTLTSGDVTFIRADSVRVEFAQVPRPGRPIVISEVALERPVVRLIEQHDGSLAGFRGFVASEGGRVLPDGGSTRLSDVLAIKEILIVAGSLSYEPLDGPHMRLSPLSFHCRQAPGTAEAGWYALEAQLKLDPVARLDIDAFLNVDTAELKLSDLRLATILRPSTYEVFTPQIQAILRRHEIQGTLSLRASGLVPLRDPKRSALDLNWDLTDGRVTFGEYVLPLEALRLAIRLDGGDLNISNATIKALGGTMELTGSLALDGPDAGRFEIAGHGEGLRLEQTIRTPSGAEPKYAGEIRFSTEATGMLGDLSGTLVGQGDVSVRDGRLRIIRVFDKLLAVGSPLSKKRAGADRGSLNFELAGDRVHLTEVHVVGGSIGVRGRGEIFYDGRLNLRFTAGPLERLDRGILKDIGKLFSTVTGQLVNYQVSGTLKEPIFAVRTFGIGGAKAATQPKE